MATVQTAYKSRKSMPGGSLQVGGPCACPLGLKKYIRPAFATAQTRWPSLTLLLGTAGCQALLPDLYTHLLLPLHTSLDMWDPFRKES